MEEERNNLRDGEILVYGDGICFKRCSLYNNPCKIATMPRTAKYYNPSSICDCPNLEEIHFNTIPDIIHTDFAVNCPKLERFTYTPSPFNHNTSFYIENSIILNSKREVYIIPEGIKGTLVIPEGPTVFNCKLLYNHRNIERVILPHSLEHLYLYVLNGCENLKEIVIQENCIKIEKDSDWRISGEYLPCTVTVHKDNPVFYSEDGVFYNKQDNTLLQVSPYKTNALNVPTFVEKVGSRALRGKKFSSCVFPKKVIFEDNNGLFYKNVQYLKKVDFLDRTQELYCNWFSSPSKENISFIERYLYNIYPYQLPNYRRKQSLPLIFSIILYSDNYTDEWIKAWNEYLSKRERELSLNLMKNTSYISSLCEKNVLSKKSISSLLDLSSRLQTAETTTILLNYQNEKTEKDGSSIIQNKEDEMENELLKALGLL